MQSKSLILLVIQLIVVVFAASSKPQLQFNDEGQFTVLIVNDVHLEYQDEVDDQTLNYLRTIIQQNKPDLVVVNGDLISGYAWDNVTPGFFASHHKRFTEIFEQTQTPYALSLGNHDIEADLTNDEIFDLEEACPWSLSVRGPRNVSGVSNYLLQVKSRLNTSNASHPALNIWVFDTHNEGCGYETNSYGCVDESQVQWYEDTSKKVESSHGKGDHMKHIAFVHIPIPEFLQVWNKAEIEGDKGEFSSCPRVNFGLFSKIKERGDISAIYAGHDHKNSFSGEYLDVEFFYGLKTGFGSYGSQKGARLVKFSEERDSDGEIVINSQHFKIDTYMNVESVRREMVHRHNRQVVCDQVERGPLLSIFMYTVGFFQF